MSFILLMAKYKANPPKIFFLKISQINYGRDDSAMNNYFDWDFGIFLSLTLKKMLIKDTGLPAAIPHIVIVRQVDIKH